MSTTKTQLYIKHVMDFVPYAICNFNQNTGEWVVNCNFEQFNGETEEEAWRNAALNIEQAIATHNERGDFGSIVHQQDDFDLPF